MQLQIPAINKVGVSSKEQTHVFQELLRAIEAVRYKRHEEYHEKLHPQLKRFTQQELNDEACPTYKNWLIGRSQRLPSRSTLMTIADYLECSLSERNDILLAAQYLPEQPQWEGEELQRALEQARQIMETLPYPAIVSTHTLQHYAANDLFLRLMGLPSLDNIPPHRRSMAGMLLQPDCVNYSMFNEEARASRKAHLIYALQLFKQQNVLFRYETWYQQLVKQWSEFPGFQEYWEAAQEVTTQRDSPPKLTLARMPTTGDVLPIRTRHMLISVSSKIYPAISALLPVDDAARAVFAALSV